MLLTDARRAARTDADGSLVPLAEQRRDRWDAGQIEEGVALMTRTLGTGPSVRTSCRRRSPRSTTRRRAPTRRTGRRSSRCTTCSNRCRPGPVVTLNRAVAVAMVDGPRAGLAVLGTLDADDRMAHTHRLDAVRGHLLELAGDRRGAREAYRRAARMTASVPEQRYLALRAARLG